MTMGLPPDGMVSIVVSSGEQSMFLLLCNMARYSNENVFTTESIYCSKNIIIKLQKVGKISVINWGKAINLSQIL